MYRRLRKITSELGHWISGLEVVFDRKLTFKDISNTLFTLNGTWLARIRSGVVNSVRLRDNTKNIDYLTIDTLNDKVYLTNPVKRITFADSPYTAEWGEDVRVNTTAGDVIVNIPTAIGNNGKPIIIGHEAKSALTKIVLVPFGLETIEMKPPYEIDRLYTSLNIISNGTGLIKR